MKYICSWNKENENGKNLIWVICQWYKTWCKVYKVLKLHSSTLISNFDLYFNVHINIKIFNKSKTPSPIFFYIDLCGEIKWILKVEEKKSLIDTSIFYVQKVQMVKKVHQ